MPLEADQCAHRHPEPPDPVGAAKVRQIDDKAGSQNIGAKLFQQLDCGLGGAVAHQVSAGFVPIRKKGKLPFKRVSIGYSLEYGIDEMEMHEDAVIKGERVILVDDLVATGGTAEAAVKLLKQLGAEVLAACFIIDLPDLGGAEKIRKLGVPVRTLISFEGH